MNKPKAGVVFGVLKSDVVLFGCAWLENANPVEGCAGFGKRVEF